MVEHLHEVRKQTIGELCGRSVPAEGLPSAKIHGNSEEQRRYKGEWEQMSRTNRDHSMFALLKTFHYFEAYIHIFKYKYKYKDISLNMYLMWPII